MTKIVLAVAFFIFCRGFFFLGDSFWKVLLGLANLSGGYTVASAGWWAMTIALMVAYLVHEYAHIFVSGQKSVKGPFFLFPFGAFTLFEEDLSLRAILAGPATGMIGIPISLSGALVGSVPVALAGTTFLLAGAYSMIPVGYSDGSLVREYYWFHLPLQAKLAVATLGVALWLGAVESLACLHVIRGGHL